MTRPLSVAVLVKQVPLAEEFRLGADGRLVREDVPLEVNPYCRRAIAKGVEIASASGGRCVAFALGPPAAEDVLREAVAAGAAEGVHLCDPAFAGSDTLATARALATAIRSAGLFDLVLAGLNSVDADTGQVAPELAELLGLPFASGVRQLALSGPVVSEGPVVLEGTVARITCERDDGIAELDVPLPAVLSVAERLCAPAKFGPAERAAVPAARIRRVRAADLGPGPWGAAGSPTRVGEVRAHDHRRERRILSGPLGDQVLEAVRLLVERSALPPGGSPATISERAGGAVMRPAPADQVPNPVDGGPGRVGGNSVAAAGSGGVPSGGVPSGGVPSDGGGSDGGGSDGGGSDGGGSDGGGSDGGGSGRGPRAVVTVIEPGRPPLARELLGAAARLAAEIGGTTIAICAEPTGPAELGAWGADRALVLESATGGPLSEQDVAVLVTSRARELGAWAILAPSTSFGRHVAARIAARLGAGLTGDAIELTTVGGRMIAWKPAFAGRLVAAISAASDVQMATLRPGAFAPLAAGPRQAAALSAAVTTPAGTIRELTRTRDAGSAPLTRADSVLAVGAGVPPEQYEELSRLRELLGAELVGTRKVTDQGWLPRNRQVGLTGHSLSPRLYLTFGVSGKFNHLVGVRRAGTVLAVNNDPQAPVFDGADIGIVGDWREAARLLAEAVAGELARGTRARAEAAPRP